MDVAVFVLTIAAVFVAGNEFSLRIVHKIDAYRSSYGRHATNR
jgi:hypothetical protein